MSGQVIIGLVGVIASASIATISFVLGARRERRKVFGQACSDLHAAFAESIAELTAGDRDVHFLMSKAKISHEAAIIAFRRHLPATELSGFDAACAKYRESRDSAEPAALEVMREQAMGQPAKDARVVRQELMAAINVVLGYANAL